MRITYSAEQHSHVHRCCGFRADAGVDYVDGRRDEQVTWTAHSEGSVLVRYFGSGTWLVNHGVLLGHIERADVTDTSTFSYFCYGKLLCQPDGPIQMGDCYKTVERRLDSSGAFKDPALVMLVGAHMGTTWFPWTSMVLDPAVRAKVHSTGDLDNCEQITPPTYPPDTTEPYTGPLPLAPHFDNSTLELIRDAPPIFTGRGRGRFGARHIFITTDAPFKELPTTDMLNTYGGFPDQETRDVKGDEHFTVKLDRCPGTKPC
ncbi:MAG: hypothetical protein ACXVII_42815 [Solirubrobacteraceae bacterium]